MFKSLLAIGFSCAAALWGCSQGTTETQRDLVMDGQDTIETEVLETPPPFRYLRLDALAAAPASYNLGIDAVAPTKADGRQLFAQHVVQYEGLTDPDAVLGPAQPDSSEDKCSAANGYAVLGVPGFVVLDFGEDLETGDDFDFYLRQTVPTGVALNDITLFMVSVAVEPTGPDWVSLGTLFQFCHSQLSVSGLPRLCRSEGEWRPCQP